MILYVRVRDSPVEVPGSALADYGGEECEVLLAFHRGPTYIFDAGAGRGISLGHDLLPAH
jgi:hypothetical protein